MRVPSRQMTYFLLRGTAGVGVIGSATLMAPGLAAGLVCIGSGLLAVFSCIGVNAGGPGEQAGARAQERSWAKIRPPQGTWPPYDAPPVKASEMAARTDR